MGAGDGGRPDGLSSVHLRRRWTLPFPEGLSGGVVVGVARPGRPSRPRRSCRHRAALHGADRGLPTRRRTRWTRSGLEAPRLGRCTAWAAYSGRPSGMRQIPHDRDVPNLTQAGTRLAVVDSPRVRGVTSPLSWAGSASVPGLAVEVFCCGPRARRGGASGSGPAPLRPKESAGWSEQRASGAGETPVAGAILSVAGRFPTTTAWCRLTG